MEKGNSDHSRGGSATQGPALPPDIGPTRKVNWVMGAGALAFAWLFALPVYTTVKHSGFRRISEWPDVFFLFALLAAGFLALGLRLMVFSQPMTGAIHFHPGGFTIRINTFWTKREDRYDWSDIAEFGREEFNNARHFFVRRVGKRRQFYGSILFGISSRNLFARLHASAMAAGYRLDSDGLNLFIYEKKVWTVQREETDDAT